MKNWKSRAFTLACVAGLAGGAAFAPEISAYAASEAEPNDGLEHAQEIEPGTEVTGNLSDGDDKDYYKITLSEAGKVNYTFKTDNETGDCYCVCFCDENGKEIISEQRIFGSADNSYTSENMGLSAGIYYVKVYWKSKYFNDPSFTTDDYHLTVDFKKVDDWEQEYNEDYDTATPIQLDTDIKGNLRNSEDKDCYKFSLDEGGKVSYTFKTDDDSGKHYSVCIYDEDGKELTDVKILYGSAGNSYTSTIIGVPKGTYYIRVFWQSKYFNDPDFTTDDYHLKVNYEKADNWEVEYNEDFESANSINAGQEIFGSIRQVKDTDVYKFNLDKASSVNVLFRHKSLDSKEKYWYVYIYDKDGKEVAKYSVTGELRGQQNINEKEALELDAGEYFAKVTCDGEWSDIEYGLEIKAEERQPEDGFHEDENGDWYWYVNGKIATDVTGYVDWKGGKFYVTKGKLDKTVNGVKMDDSADPAVWYFCANGQVQMQHKGLALYDGEWFYIENGKVVTDMNKFLEYDGGLFAIAAGRKVSEYSGLMQDPENTVTGDWYFFAEGQAQTQYTGLAQYDGEWFYVVKGKLAVDYTGTVDYDGATFNVVNGMVK